MDLATSYANFLLSLLLMKALCVLMGSVLLAMIMPSCIKPLKASYYIFPNQAQLIPRFHTILLGKYL